MTYPLAQFWFYLLLAGLAGSILGWILRGGCKRYAQTLENLQSKYRTMEIKNSTLITHLMREKNAALAQVNKSAHHKQQNARLSAQYSAIKREHNKVRRRYQQTEKKLRNAAELIVFAKQDSQAKTLKLKQLQEDSAATENLLNVCQADWDQRQQAMQKSLHIAHMKQARTETHLTHEASTVTKLIAQANTVEKQQQAMQKSLQITQTKQADTETRLAYEASTVAKLTALVNTLEQQKNRAENQLESFKNQSEGYISSITEKNRHYKATLSLLDGDLQQTNDKLVEKEEEIDKIRADFNYNTDLIADLKEQLERERTAELPNIGYELLPSHWQNNTSRKKRASNEKVHILPFGSDRSSRWKRMKGFTSRRRT